MKSFVVFVLEYSYFTNINIWARVTDVRGELRKGFRVLCSRIISISTTREIITKEKVSLTNFRERKEVS